MTSYNYERSVYEAEPGDIEMAITGESLITRAVRMYREPAFLSLADKIRNADLAFTHTEMVFHNYEDYPAYRSGGTYVRSDPRNIAELQWMGFDIVSTASNHSYDYMEGGVMTNIRNLNQYGMPFAGTGANLAAARAPGYVDTPKGRVGLISATTSGPPPARALEQRRDMQGKPGANFIRHTVEWTVDKPTWDLLHQLSENLGFEAIKRGGGGSNFFAGMGAGPSVGHRGADSDNEFHLIGLWPPFDSISFMRFHLGDRVERRTIPNPDDLAGMLQRVRDARGMAEWVICTLHSHDVGNAPEVRPAFVTEIMHACIDAGADVFVGHGPHQDYGIEIYKGKPIFHSLGDFFLQNDTVVLQPHENYLGQGLSWEATPNDFYTVRSGNETRGQAVQPVRWQTALAMTKWNRGKEFAEIRLHPVDLGYGKPRSERGRPVFAEGGTSNEILDRFERLSAPLGTKIKREGNVGIIRP